MKLVVLGMHRSGHSALTGLLNLMGAYFDSVELSRHASEWHPAACAERIDVRSLNEVLLNSVDCDWNCVNTFSVSRMSPRDIEAFNVQATKLLAALNVQQPWVISDPGLCLLFPLWQPIIPDCVCIHLYRNPIEVAKSLQALNGTPISVGIALWEKYTRAALYASREQLNLFVSYRSLVTEPQAVVQELLAQLSAHGLDGLSAPTQQELEALIDTALYRQRDKDEDCPQFLNVSQTRLFQSLLDGNIAQEAVSQELSGGGSLVLQYFELENYRTQPQADGTIDELHAESGEKEIQYRQELDALQGRASAWQREVSSLQRIMERLVRGVGAMSGSNTWKIGSKIVSAKQKLLGRKSGPSAIHSVNDAISDYESWKARTAVEQERILSTSDCGQIANSSRPILQRFPTVDIVVCVHNALDDVICCLSSIVENTRGEYTLHIVNDGSGKETTEFLREFKSSHSGTVLLENEQAGGYTKAANRGLRECSSEYVVCLNSDTIVPRLWLNCLIECAESDPSIGIVGPLSNAASWQSVPERFDDSGDWTVNELPAGFDVNQMAELVYEVSEKRFPRVAFVNGFCFAIKRAVIDAIGYLDEEAFPEGYGEENDYCLRASAAGFRLAIADQAYVYHSKSKSYSHSKRRLLSKKGGTALKNKHGGKKIDRGVEALKNSEDLQQARALIRQYLQCGLLERRKRPGLPSVLYVVSAGAQEFPYPVIQEAAALSAIGISAKVAAPVDGREGLQSHDPALIKTQEQFVSIADEDDLCRVSESFDIIVATSSRSLELVKPVAEKNQHLLAAYYIRGYEPWSFEQGSEDWLMSCESYASVKDMCLFAETDRLCGIVQEGHGVKVWRVCRGLDNKVYFPSRSAVLKKEEVTVCAMLSPASSMQAACTALGILQAVKAASQIEVKIVTFGCEKERFEELRAALLSQPVVDFEFEHLGILYGKQAAGLFRSADIFVDFADDYSLSSVGLEAMACGCAVILPAKCDADDYAIHQVNAVTVDTKSQGDMEQALAHIIDDHDFRHRLQKSGLATAASYSTEGAALSRLSLFRQAMAERDIRRRKKIVPLEISEERPIRVIIWPCVMQNSIEPTGSAYIRLIEPLGSKSIASRVRLSIVHSMEQLKDQQADICIVQRNVIRDEAMANSLFGYCHSQQMKVLLEIDDDLFNLQDNEPATLGNEELRALKVVAARSHAVITATPALQLLLRGLNTNVFCIQNALSEDLWGLSQVKPEPGVRRPVRLLYMGTRTHARDLALIKNAWKRIEEKYNGRVTLDIIGAAATEDLEFGNAIAIPPSLRYPEFVQWLQTQGPWDIGLIPLRDTGFNRKKSPIKFLDYSALGLAIVCSKVAAYSDIAVDGENALLVNNSGDEWYEAMARLIDNQALRRELGNKAYSGLMENYCLESRARDWLDTFRNVVNG